MHAYRTETDTLGSVEIPLAAAWGSQTQRALKNFPITGVAINHYPNLIVSLASVKKPARRPMASWARWIWTKRKLSQKSVTKS